MFCRNLLVTKPRVEKGRGPRVWPWNPAKENRQNKKLSPNNYWVTIFIFVIIFPHLKK